MAVVAEQSEPILTATESDQDEPRLAPAPPPASARLSLAGLLMVALLALAGVHGWKRSISGQPVGDSGGILRLDEAYGEMDTPAPATTSAPPQSIGIKSLYSEAVAASGAMKTALAAASSLGGVAEHEDAIARDLLKQKHISEEMAEQVIATARILEHQGKANLSAAAVLNKTAQTQEKTAAHMDRQADKSILSANKMLSSAGDDAEAITSLTAKQKKVAKATKEQAASLMRKAQGIEDRAADISATAQEDLATAAALKEEGSAETKAADALGEEADKFATLATNAKEKAKAAKATATSQGSKATELTKTAKSAEGLLVEANKELIAAGAQSKQAQAQIKQAEGAIVSARAIDKTAQQETAAADAVSHELGVQKKSFNEALAKAVDLKAASTVGEIFAEDLKAVSEEEKQVAEERAGAKVLVQKAEVTNSNAEMKIKASKKAQKAARTAEKAANDVIADISSEARLGAAGAGEVLGLNIIKDQNAAVVEAAESEVEAVQGLAQEETTMAKSEAAGGAHLLGRVPTASAQNSKLIKTVADNVNAMAQQTQQRIGTYSDMAQSVNVDSLKNTAREAVDAANARKHEIEEEAKKRRTCVDMPGVRVEASRDIAEISAASHEECKEKCQGMPGCQQVIFSGAKGCHLSYETTGKASDFDEAFTSSFCGSKDDELALMDRLHKLYDQKPRFTPAIECSWTDEDCSHTKCCNHFKCRWDFSKCWGQTCYKKDDTFASCREDAPPKWWDGDVLGGPRDPRELPKAEGDVLTQGSSLFCFSVVMWKKPARKEYYDTEAELANNWKKKGHGILQCDEHALIEGEDSTVTDWGTVDNVDSFIHAWEQVRKDGRYKKHDWVVKVDPDTVLIPDRLKLHLGALKVPKHAKVYLWNADLRFNFLGSLEVLTTEALDAYFEHADQCSTQMEHKGGEDFYMKTCLDGIGVDHVTDFKVLNDKALEQKICADGWAAAFHPYRSVDDWDKCYTQANAQ